MIHSRLHSPAMSNISLVYCTAACCMSHYHVRTHRVTRKSKETLCKELDDYLAKEMQCFDCKLTVEGQV